MQDCNESEVVDQLETMSAELLAHVAELLSHDLPAVPLSPIDQDARRDHMHRVRMTVERFHCLVQIGVTVDWQLVLQEYEWAARVLRRLGITWDHQTRLIDTYFSVAIERGQWTADQKAALKRIAEHIRQSGHAVYS